MAMSWQIKRVACFSAYTPQSAVAKQKCLTYYKNPPRKPTPSGVEMNWMRLKSQLNILLTFSLLYEIILVSYSRYLR